MASRRLLKKHITQVCGELFYLCVVSHIKDAASIVEKIEAMYEDLICRISHTEQGSEKLFYRKLKADFQQHVNNLLEEIAAASKEAQDEQPGQ